MHAVSPGNLDREWQTSDRVELTLPMEVERLEAHPAVRQAAGQVAVQRGPIVYCLEEADNGPNLHQIQLPHSAKLTTRFDPKLLGGVTVVAGKAKRETGDGSLYTTGKLREKTVTLRAVPYCTWANRKPGEMLVWIREA